MGNVMPFIINFGIRFGTSSHTSPIVIKAARINGLLLLIYFF